MTSHLLNIWIHIGAGCIAMAFGFWILASAKGTARHRSLGRFFAGFTLLVCLTGAVGNAVFRFMPLFAVLTLLVSYQLLSGWHVVYTREQGPNRLDAILCVGGAGGALWLIPFLSQAAGTQTSLTVVYSTLAALFVLIFYDALRWCFPRRWHARLWWREHVYKLVSALFAMLSAAAGNLLPWAQPWSQLLPSVTGLLVITVLMLPRKRRGQLHLPSRSNT